MKAHEFIQLGHHFTKFALFIIVIAFSIMFLIQGYKRQDSFDPNYNVYSSKEDVSGEYMRKQTFYFQVVAIVLLAGIFVGIVGFPSDILLDILKLLGLVIKPKPKLDLDLVF